MKLKFKSKTFSFDLESEFKENVKLKYVIQKDFFKEIQEIVLCPKCNDLFIDPYMCLNCRNTLCRDCLDEFDESNCNKCQNCESTSFKLDKNTQKLIEKLYFECKNGCGITSIYTSLQSHLRECKKKKRHSNKSDKEIKVVVNKKTPQQIQTKKIILLGITGVGKSSVLKSFMTDSPATSNLSTIGFETSLVTYNLSDGTTMKFQILDTAGQEKFRSITPSYLRGISGAVLMYDITNEKSFPENDSYFLEILKNAYPEKLPPIILVGNKSDLESCRKIPQEDAIKFAEENKFLYKESSAKMNDNIKDVFSALFEMINFEYKLNKEPEIEERPSIVLDPEVHKKKKIKEKCCKK